ncbi:MAG TPA: DUF4043 family protein [Calditerricola sp.]
MAVSTIQANNRGIIFRNNIIREYVRGNMFSPYMGNDATAVIRTLLETGKYGGDQINVPLIKALSNTAISTGTLVGNEEAIDNYGCRLWLDWARNAVVATKAEIKKGSFDLFGQAQPLLAEWGKSLQRDEIVLAMAALPSESAPANLGTTNGQRVNGILYSAANATEKNTWNQANQDRILYGNEFGNYNATHATALANLTATDDRFSAATVRLAREKAEDASPKIDPLTTNDGYERFIMFVGSRAYRDAWADPEIYQANKDARPREGSSWRDNPIFREGDLLYDNVIIRKVPEIDKYCLVSGAGDSGVDVSMSFLCGRSALGFVWGQMPEPTKLDDTDYQFRKGVGIDMAYGVGKLFFKDSGSGDLVQWGMVTVFNAAPATQ